MDMEKSITDVALLKELYALPDARPVLSSGVRAAGPNHDESDGRNLWLSLRNHLRWLWAVWRGKRNQERE